MRSDVVLSQALNRPDHLTEAERSTGQDHVVTTDRGRESGAVRDRMAPLMPNSRTARLGGENYLALFVRRAHPSRA